MGVGAAVLVLAVLWGLCRARGNVTRGFLGIRGLPFAELPRCEARARDRDWEAANKVGGVGQEVEVNELQFVGGDEATAALQGALQGWGSTE